MLDEREWLELPSVAEVLVDVTGLDDLAEITREVRRRYAFDGGLVFDQDPFGHEWAIYTDCRPRKDNPK